MNNDRSQKLTDFNESVTRFAALFERGAFSDYRKAEQLSRDASKWAGIAPRHQHTPKAVDETSPSESFKRTWHKRGSTVASTRKLALRATKVRPIEPKYPVTKADVAWQQTGRNGRSRRVQ
jgi:hypothetical protein